MERWKDVFGQEYQKTGNVADRVMDRPGYRVMGLLEEGRMIWKKRVLCGQGVRDTRRQIYGIFRYWEAGRQ